MCLPYDCECTEAILTDVAHLSIDVLAAPCWHVRLRLCPRMNARKPSEHSPELLATQERLLQLRASLPGKPMAGQTPAGRLAQPEPPDLARLGQDLLQERRRREARVQGVQASDALKAALPAGIQLPVGGPPQLPQSAPAPSGNPGDQIVKVYPDLAVGMLKAGLAAPGRVYWLLRAIDRQGTGWLWVDDIRRQLTDTGAPFCIFSWRRLRQLLVEGEGVFWQRDKAGRLWLAGAAKIAAILAVERLTGLPVDMPVSQLLGGIRAVRAHFYASFHSGRPAHRPISRNTLRELTDVPERSQQEYERVAGVKSQRNIAVGERYSQEEVQERSWRQGRATFRFVDVKGKQGREGQAYVAWHMPNSYEGPHNRCCKGRQKKINQELSVVVKQGIRRNGLVRVERLFWPQGAAAGKAHNRNQEVDAYWPDDRSGTHRTSLWHVIVAADNAFR